MYALLLLKQNHFPYALIPYLPVLESDLIGPSASDLTLLLMFVSFLLNGRGGGIRTLIVWFVAKESIRLAYAPMGSLLGVEPSIRGSQPRVIPIHQKLHEAGAGRENRTPSLRFRKPPLCPVELRPHGWRGGNRTHGVLVYQTSALTTSPLSNETWLPLEDSNFLLTPSKGAGLPIIPSGTGWGNVNRTHVPRFRAECTTIVLFPNKWSRVADCSFVR